jgi:hypothetical protein
MNLEMTQDEILNRIRMLAAADPNKEIIRSINKRYRKPKNTCFCGAKIKTSDVRFADYFDILGDWNLYVNGNS